MVFLKITYFCAFLYYGNLLFIQKLNNLHFCILSVWPTKSCSENALVLLHFVYLSSKQLTKTKWNFNRYIIGTSNSCFINVLWVAWAFCPSSCSGATPGWGSGCRNSWLHSVSPVVFHWLLKGEFSDIFVKQLSTHWPGLKVIICFFLTEKT